MKNTKLSIIFFLFNILQISHGMDTSITTLLYKMYCNKKTTYTCNVFIEQDIQMTIHKEENVLIINTFIKAGSFEQRDKICIFHNFQEASLPAQNILNALVEKTKIKLNNNHFETIQAAFRKFDSDDLIQLDTYTKCSLPYALTIFNITGEKKMELEVLCQTKIPFFQQP
ncbi:MAG: hypothetical protein WA432_04585 [Candidatus Babeliaceae bacterium]